MLITTLTAGGGVSTGPPFIMKLLRCAIPAKMLSSISSSSCLLEILCVGLGGSGAGICISSSSSRLGIDDGGTDSISEDFLCFSRKGNVLLLLRAVLSWSIEDRGRRAGEGLSKMLRSS